MENPVNPSDAAQAPQANTTTAAAATTDVPTPPVALSDAASAAAPAATPQEPTGQAPSSDEVAPTAIPPAKPPLRLHASASELSQPTPPAVILLLESLSVVNPAVAEVFKDVRFCPDAWKPPTTPLRPATDATSKKGHPRLLPIFYNRESPYTTFVETGLGIIAGTNGKRSVSIFESDDFPRYYGIRQELGGVLVLDFLYGSFKSIPGSTMIELSVQYTRPAAKKIADLLGSDPTQQRITYCGSASSFAPSTFLPSVLVPDAAAAALPPPISPSPIPTATPAVVATEGNPPATVTTAPPAEELAQENPDASEADALGARLEKSSRKLEKKKTELATAGRRYADLEETHALVQAEKLSLEDKVQALEGMAKTVAAVHAKSAAEYQALVADAQRQTNIIKAKATSAEYHVSELSAALRNSREDADAYKRANIALQKNLTRARDELQYTHSDLKTARVRLDDEHSAHTNTKRKRDEDLTKLAQAEKKLRDQAVRTRELETLLATAQAAAQTAAEKVRSLENRERGGGSSWSGHSGGDSTTSMFAPPKPATQNGWRF